MVREIYKPALKPEDVEMLSQLLDEWCYETGNDRCGKAAEGVARELVAWFENGAAVDKLRQLVFARFRQSR
jgi:hypothetical protein